MPQMSRNGSFCLPLPPFSYTQESGCPVSLSLLSRIALWSCVAAVWSESLSLCCACQSFKLVMWSRGGQSLVVIGRYNGGGNRPHSLSLFNRRGRSGLS